MIWFIYFGIAIVVAFLLLWDTHELTDASPAHRPELSPVNWLVGCVLLSLFWPAVLLVYFINFLATISASPWR